MHEPLPRHALLHKSWRVGFLPGFLFWVAFLLVLEPDNVLRALHAGYELSLDHELLRILGAACIGSAATPLVLYMSRSHPVEGAQWWRNALLHALTMTGLAAALIVTSCFAAAWAFGHRLIPSVAYVLQELVSNWTLLLFALTCLTAITHVARRPRSPRPQPPTAAAPPLADTPLAAASLAATPLAETPLAGNPLARVLVTTRGHREWITIGDVDWIESQGNYVTMHVGARTHWVRQTLSAFEARLDRTRFARIHRRTIVALDRIQDIMADGNGEASLRLKDGSTLRASRKYRKDLSDRWLGFGTRRRTP
jgi:hypothetical protein